MVYLRYFQQQVQVNDATSFGTAIEWRLGLCPSWTSSEG